MKKKKNETISIVELSFYLQETLKYNDTKQQFTKNHDTYRPYFFLRNVPYQGKIFYLKNVNLWSSFQYTPYDQRF